MYDSFSNTINIFGGYYNDYDNEDFVEYNTWAQFVVDEPAVSMLIIVCDLY